MIAAAGSHSVTGVSDDAARHDDAGGEPHPALRTPRRSEPSPDARSGARPEDPSTGPGPAPPAAPLSPAARRVQAALAALGVDAVVIESSRSARTAREAAALVGCQVGQIAKSLVFRTATTGRPVLVITSGANQVNEWRVGVLLREALEKAPAAFVREHTGFAIGGVPPVGHPQPLETFIDQDLLAYPEVWAAAGTPHALVRLAPADLVRMTGGRVVKVT